MKPARSTRNNRGQRSRRFARGRAIPAVIIAAGFGLGCMGTPPTRFSITNQSSQTVYLEGNADSVPQINATLAPSSALTVSAEKDTKIWGRLRVGTQEFSARNERWLDILVRDSDTPGKVIVSTERDIFDRRQR